MELNEETFEITWEKFKTNLLINQQDLHQEKHFADVTLVSDDQIPLKAHKVVLSACSPVLRNLLLNNPHPHPLLYMRGVQHQLLKSLLQFMYTGGTRVWQDQVDAFFAVGQDFKVKGLEESTNKDMQSSAVMNELTKENFNYNDDNMEEGESIKDMQIEESKESYICIRNNLKEGEQNISLDEKMSEPDYKAKSMEKQLNEPNNSLHSCNLCDFVTKHKSSLRVHKAEIHDGVKFGCDQCK